MQTGTLVRGNLNQLLGIVLDFKRSSSGHGMARVYWFDIQEQSTHWLFTGNLEVL
tara:strand:+ start:146 stop:310 length:165 start_codon:yes stop_codon:yes gene_type:complete